MRRFKGVKGEVVIEREPGRRSMGRMISIVFPAPVLSFRMV